MNIKNASFLTSSPDLKRCPAGNLPEYAFAGRSNVGKSSLINMLTNHKKLAKISSTPGKTQLINHFVINEEWYLVDLPGYGYAKVSKKISSQFVKAIENYLLKRDSLMCVFALADIRVPMQENDSFFYQWLGINQIPFVILFTKCDKLSGNKIRQQLDQYKKAMEKDWEEMPPYFLTSSKDKTGRDEVLGFIEKTNGLFSPSAA